MSTSTNIYTTSDNIYNFVTFANNGIIKFNNIAYMNKCLLISISHGLQELNKAGKIDIDVPDAADLLSLTTCTFNEMMSIGKSEHCRNCTDIVKFIAEIYGVSLHFYNNQYSGAIMILNPGPKNIINILNIDDMHFEYINEIINYKHIQYDRPYMSANARREADANYLALLEYLKNTNDEKN